MDNHLSNHRTSKKEKELYLSLFRIPLNFFSEETNQPKKQKIQLQQESTSSTSFQIEGKVTSKNSQPNPVITVKAPTSTPKLESIEEEFETKNEFLPDLSQLPTPEIPNIPEESLHHTSTSTVQSDTHLNPDITTESSSPSSLSSPSQTEIIPSNETTPTSVTATIPPQTFAQISQPSHTTTPLPNTTTGAVPSQEAIPSQENDSPQTSEHQENEQTTMPETNMTPTGEKSQGSTPDEMNSFQQPKKQSSEEDNSPKESEAKDGISTKQPNGKTSDTDKSPKDPKSKDENTAKQPNEKPSDMIDKARDMKKKSPNDKVPDTPKSDSPLDNVRGMKKKADALKDYAKEQAKKRIPQKLQDKALNALDVKNKAMDKVAPALNTAKNVNNMLNGSNDDKAEAVGDLALKGANAALKASGAGAPIAAAINVADQFIGKTEIGKKVKQTCGYCSVCSCCSSVLLLVMPFFLFVSLFSSIWGWIFGLQANSDDIDKANLENAITEEMLFDQTKNGYTIYDLLEERLKDDEYGFMKIVYDENGNILYDEEGFQVLESISGGTSFSDLYTDYDLAPQGQFSTAYEVLISNYTVAMIKEPRHDTGISSLHMPLFQNILEKDFPTLRNHFYNSQVPDEFWDMLTNCLDSRFNVYHPLLGTTIDVSLRELLIETSSTSGDAEYDTYTVEAILNYTKNEGNLALAKEFRRLQEAITRVEVMTYMMTIRDFYDQKTEFLNKLKFDPLSGKAAENYSFFAKNDGEFFDQFLLIPDVESYMALSNTTATPAFAYDIAVASMNTLNQSNAPRMTYNGKVYYFFETIKTWSASYLFYNSLVPKTSINPDNPSTADPNGDEPWDGEEGDYSLVCTDIIPTRLEENLYKRYNITDTESFFNFFESSTGIKLSTEADVSTFFLVTQMLPHETEASFPLLAKTSITIGFGQKYSDETVQKFGLTHKEHSGVDFSAKEGTPVLAIKDGTVIEVVPSDTGWGNYVKIRHPDGYTSTYAHGNGTFNVGVGSSVSVGQQIMESGNSGNSTGPHLHLEVSDPSGTKVNPISYINGTLAASRTTSKDN